MKEGDEVCGRARLPSLAAESTGQGESGPGGRRLTGFMAGVSVGSRPQFTWKERMKLEEVQLGLGEWQGDCLTEKVVQDHPRFVLGY